jgi:hypothetical protein
MTGVHGWMMQLAGHVSPSTVLPSSHVSLPSTTPLPQTGGRVVVDVLVVLEVLVEVVVVLDVEVEVVLVLDVDVEVVVLEVVVVVAELLMISTAQVTPATGSPRAFTGFPMLHAVASAWDVQKLSPGQPPGVLLQ